MPEKINPGNGNIIIVLTPEEYETFKQACMDLLEYYQLGKVRASKITDILNKLEEAHK